ncbi:hypothetical protein CWO91_28410 [Bradyrhizobium genosp. SA-3]|nr:hypothetical protein CWO91_28410 [Bradyrhizobium genosp. SA-3]
MRSASLPRQRRRGLERACKEVGSPTTIRVDQGSEFGSRNLDLRAYQRGVSPDFSQRGKPNDNCWSVFTLAEALSPQEKSNQAN